MSRVRTNIVKPFNADSITVEHPSLTGSLRIHGTNVSMGSPGNGQALVYDGTQQRWRPTSLSGDGSPVGGASSLKQLTDVVLATDVEGNVIETDGAWLQFNNDPTHPYYRFWTATSTLDGGEY